MEQKYNRLDKDQAALLLVDHQSGLISLVQDFTPDDFKNSVIALADVGKFFNLPTVITTSFDEGPNGAIVPEIVERHPNAPFIQRPGQINAWDNEDFVKAVKATGRKNLIMAGVTTDVCLVFPAISAVEEGFRVQAVMDASGSPFDLSEDMSRRRMENAGVVLTATNTIMAELAQDWSRPEGGQLLGILFGEVLPSMA